MSIDTRIEGNADSIRRAADWLRLNLQAGVYDCASQVYRARTQAESGWRGPASSAFQAKMSTAAKGTDSIAEDAGRLSQSFDHYADGLHTALLGMQRAREIARQSGLVVNGDTIEEPSPAPIVPQAQRIQAEEDYLRKVAAFKQAKNEADRAVSILDEARRTAEAFWKDLAEKKYLHAADFTNGVAGDLIALHRSILKKESTRLLDEAGTAEARYLASPGGSAESRFQEKLRFTRTMQAAELEAEAATAGRTVAGKLPVIGVGVAAAGVGYDIYEGKSPGKAVFSGVVGTAGGILAASMVGGPVGLAAGAAVAGGVIAGLGADWVYDHAMPEGAKRKIDDGLDALGHGVGDAGRAVGDAFESIL